MMPRYSLRASLLACVVGLTAGALLLVGATAVAALRAYLLERTDEQLAAAAVVMQRRTVLLADDDRPSETLRSVASVTQYLIEFRRPDGATVRLMADEPLPARPLLDLADPEVAGPQTVRVAPDARYRVVVVHSDGVTALVGLPLAPVGRTVRRLVLVLVGTSVTTLVLLVALARQLVARRLRPLDEIAATATALADGDLDRRVPAPRPGERAAGTEVGRLSLAVNGMLARIQAALAARDGSQRRMREFVADASHELRTPVTSISGYLQLVRTGVVDLRQRPDVLRRLEEEATRMGALVADLLYLARLDADPPARREDVDLAAVVRDAVADARAVEPARPLTVEAPAVCVVTGDGGTLRQAVANLLANVRAHTPPGTPAGATVVPIGDRIRITVTDAGPGMAAEEAAHAFDRFWRADQARTGAGGTGGAGRGGGAGLGLAIVAEAVRAHGGEVGIDTAPGAGTTVWIELPADGPGAPDGALDGALDGGPDGGRLDGGPDGALDGWPDGGRLDGGPAGS